METKSSFFSSLRRTEEAPPAPAAPPAAAPLAPIAPDTSALKKRLEQLEERLQASQGGSDERSARLEQLEARLKETQSGSDARAFRLEAELRLAREEAVASMTMLREREEAQKAAQAEMEKLLRTMTEQRRSEEHDRRTREQLLSQKKRIEDLEAMLIAGRQTASATDSREAAERAPLEIESLRSAASEFARLQERLGRAEDVAAQAHFAAKRLEGLRESVETVKGMPDEMRAEMAAVKTSLEKDLREMLNRYLAVLEEAVRSVKR